MRSLAVCLAAVFVTGCVTARPAKKGEAIRNDLWGSEVLRVKEFPSLDAAPAVSDKKISFDCVYEVQTYRDDEKPVRSEDLSRSQRSVCEKLVEAALKAKGAVLVRDKAAMPERWVVIVDELRSEGDLARNLFFPPEFAKISVSLSRFASGVKRPYSYLYAEGESEYWRATSHLGAEERKGDGPGNANSLMTILVNGVLAQGLIDPTAGAKEIEEAN
jgi:hypothetical protein